MKKLDDVSEAQQPKLNEQKEEIAALNAGNF